MRRLLILLIALAFALGVSAVVLALPVDAAVCHSVGGSLTRTDGVDTTPTPITNVRAGQDGCFDRLVVDIAGPSAAGFTVGYVSVVLQDASGLPVTVPGGARLQLVVKHPTNTTHTPSVAGFRTLRSVVFAGSFEGVTTYGVGTRARLPFRVFTLTGPGGNSRLVLDVFHHW